jgi:hypothetical protein
VLASTLLDTVRDTLQDAKGIRYTSPSLIRALNLGILEIRRTRPDFFVGQFTTPTAQVVAETDDVPVPEVCVPSLVLYTAGFAELRDDEYTSDGRAQAMLGKFVKDFG